MSMFFVPVWALPEGWTEHKQAVCKDPQAFPPGCWGDFICE